MYTETAKFSRNDIVRSISVHLKGTFEIASIGQMGNVWLRAIDATNRWGDEIVSGSLVAVFCDSIEKVS